MDCPKCGSECWDNRQKVAGGWKGPIWKCRDRDCGWLQWPPKDAQAKKAATAGPRAGPKWTWHHLAKTYERCLLTAELRVLASAERLGVKATVGDILQATATIFIEAARNGVEEPKVKLPPKPPEPEPMPVPDEDENEQEPWE